MVFNSISAALFNLSSPSYRRSHVPWLILPTHHEDSVGDGGCVFYSLEERKVYSANNCLYDDLRDNCCVGSSHGWLLLLGKTGNLFLLNPLSGNRVHLPSMNTFPCILKISDWRDGVEIIFDDANIPSSLPSKIFMSIRKPEDHFIYKAVLLSEPSVKNNSVGVVVLYGFQQQKLAFCRYGDSRWTKLEGKHKSYCDIICNYVDDEFYALASNGSIEVWDFNINSGGSAIKKKDIKASFPEKLLENNEWSDTDRFSTRCYLVKSSGDFLLVVRYIGEFVNAEGEALCEADLLDEGPHPLVCPYKTLKFMVFKLDLKNKMWVAVEDLGDSVLFLGGSHSMSLSAQDFAECEKNSIYFTDDYWIRMNEDYLYGGHDMGVFNLKDGNVKEFCENELDKFVPPPFWVVPNL